MSCGQKYWAEKDEEDVKREAKLEPLDQLKKLAGQVVMGDVKNNAAVKQAKPRVSLLFSFGTALAAVSDVLTFGAKKYADDSWKREPFTKDNYFDAMGRHIIKVGEGELRDAETGFTHAAHIATNALMYCWHVLKEVTSDAAGR